MTLFKKGLPAGRQGFTLIELLVTIGVLAVVAAGVIATINPQQKIFQARDAQTQSGVGQIATALQSWAAVNNGLYPAALATLVTDGEMTVLPPAAPGAGGWVYSVSAGNAAAELHSNLQATRNLVGGAPSFWCWRSASGLTVAVTAAFGCAP
ncbi:hypothetical protein A2634_01715 [Candidatus Amesbacteria bacterium RIFCSPHIGHO2_01_FULL_48_32]|uniref:Type II secretion system protein GspG C-terminal domain-containing protein n=1 Tax=Candidatus Amesbacteria bacterium RIFCSPLOWO2_01_FULL_48_25 TaxID=1797259 RepID=A0A1F4ZBK7_9BACT|nr:MAG: hypothetical protein A2634_01715 [Candidatus Amesbacteria bacterium RIFCSPHIGHO2_01_FULL_48_32]OGD03759.1 MAG: hypothetical protein A2989_03700 [Candidatus Amesbacteria bacterium RIFCSPLOWO2_01_FULL_48_25]